MLRRQWKNKKRENLIVLGVLIVTLLAVFLAGGAAKINPAITRLLEKISQPAVIRWEAPQKRETPTSRRSAEMRKRLNSTKEAVADLVKDLQGTYGVYVEDLETGVSFGINENRIFTAASLIKLPVFVAVYQEVEKGNFSLSTSYKLQVKDKVSGAGSMYYAESGTVYTYEQMLELMGKQSDNTAFNIFVKLLGGDKIQAVIGELGMKETSLAENETTPRDMGKFFRKMYGDDKGNPPSPGLRRTSREKIFEYLTDTIFEDRIPAGIPKGVRVAHKVGSEAGVVSDAGIVFDQRPFILVILSEGVKESEAKEVLPKIANLIFTDLNTDFRR